MNEEQETNPEPESEPSAQAAPSETAPPRSHRPAPGLTLKVSAKGALSVYGLGRFPVTLYKEQWLRLLGMSDELRAFISENDSALKSKSAS